MTDSRHRIAAVLFICLTLGYGAYVVSKYEAYTYTYADPGWMVSTVMSIAEDHDLDLRNQLKYDPKQAADQTSQGKEGQWYPLHELVMPILTVPFYLVFGINGCLVFNVLVSILLMVLLFYLSARHVSGATAFTATVLTAFATLFLNHTYSYSLDVFSAFVLVLAYWSAVNHRYLLTGFIWALAILSRLPNVVTLAGLIPFLVLSGLPEPSSTEADAKVARFPARVRPLLLCSVGALPVAICFFAMNRAMFGSVFTTSYDRWQHFVNGVAVASSQRDAFSASLIDRLRPVLADPHSGLLIGGPLILVALAFGSRLFWEKARNEAVMSGAMSLSLLVLFSKYSNAFPGSYGNRYLMPIVALSTIPLAFALETCLHPRGDAFQ